MTYACSKCYKSSCDHWLIIEKTHETKGCCCGKIKTLSIAAKCSCGKTGYLFVDESVLAYKCFDCGNQLIHTTLNIQFTNKFIHDFTKSNYPLTMCQNCIDSGKRCLECSNK